jgi:phospholipid transport system substrate-binding protein
VFNTPTGTPRGIGAAETQPENFMTLTTAVARFTTWFPHRVVAGMIGSLVLLTVLTLPASAQLADPAVAYMDRAAKDIIAASRTRSLATLQSAIMRHADLGYMGGIGLGDYRDKLVPTDKQTYYTGMTRFMSKYALSEGQKYQVSHLTFQPGSRPAKYGLMVDSTVHMRDGSSYDVQWMLYKQPGGYKIRDAQILTFWMTPQLQRLFTNYIGENGGNVKALLIALNR